MSVPEGLPPIDLTTAVIDAVNLALQLAGIDPLSILLSLFSGKPKLADTDAVISAYNDSAYWPLHALATNLEIAAKNGAPISDSRPAIQAQFSTWKLGTIQSIQSFAGEKPGSASPGYWTLAQLIDQSWAASGNGVQSVLQYVKAIDAITIQLSLAAQPTPAPKPPPKPTPGPQPKTPPPPPPPPPPPVHFPIPPPPPDPSVSDDPESDEILDCCRATQKNLTQIINLLAQPPQSDGSASECCTNLVTAIAAATAQLTSIATALVFPPAPGQGVDLTPVIDALTTLNQSLQVYATATTGSLDAIATAIATPTPIDLSQVVNALNEIAKELTPDATSDAKVRAAIEYWNSLNAIDPGIVQLVLG